MPTPAGRRGARLALVALGLLALLAIVAAATRGGFGHRAGGRAVSSTTFVSWSMSALLVLMIAAAPFAVWAFVVQQREGGIGRESKGFARRVLEPLAACALVVAAILLVRGRVWNRLFGQAPQPKHVERVLTRPLKSHTAHQAAQAHFEWPVLAVALAIALAAVAYTVVRRRRASATEQGPPGVDEELAASIADAIDDLEAEPDARRAVVAAYARMEAVLARHGLRRRPSQTPLEYLRAVLASLSGRGGAATRLTGLFEEAQFSTHAVDLGMKRDAIDALRTIRDGLLEAEPA